MKAGGDSSIRYTAIAALILLFCLPDDGFGVSLCPFHFFTDIPCPLCGLTRSMTCLTHFHLQQSLSFHPLGWAVLLLILLTAVTNRTDFLKSHLRMPGDAQNILFSARAFTVLVSGVWVVRLWTGVI